MVRGGRRRTIFTAGAGKEFFAPTFARGPAEQAVPVVFPILREGFRPLQP